MDENKLNSRDHEEENYYISPHPNPLQQERA
jgi:hypothetical protein